MPLSPFATYSPDSIRASIEVEGCRSEAWGGELLFGERGIALVTTVGEPDAAPHLLSPTRFRYRPRAEYRPPDAEYGWMPRRLAQHSATGTPVYLFLGEAGAREYYPFGEMVLGMFSGATDASRQHATFSLQEKVPREIWLKLGGYPGWKLSLNHTDHVLEPGDTAGLNDLLERVAGEESVHLSLTRYEGDTLEALVNGSLGYVSYEDVYGGSETSRNPLYDEDTEEAEPFFCSCGKALDMPLCYVITRDQVLAAVEELFDSGRQPGSIEWCDF